ncbi:putative disease resistance protein At3g14460 isoform X2 [Juglans microcarpa x Juglans regia]|uniref:putative disease resistance protein At3g14460 isoform X2 n=1 Tax=Juglans microcarpa x Juglans regia TaxID=2249226 RepID=UPI001B7DB4D3|nr:putative disease resistance protein At3g14460 isoform X2 [Juglans microcarpa x Juglans regia]
MPIQMGRLQCLQTLTKFIVSKHNGSRIGELGRLLKLKGKLSIWDLQNVESVKDALDANLKDRDYLEELVLQWNDTSDKLNISDIQRGVLENLQPHKNLKRLTINNYDGESFPNWIGLPLFSNITYLDLRNCKYCCALPPRGQLSSLNELVIDGFDGVVTVGPEFYGNNSSTMKPFGMLKSLRLENMSNWEKWFPFGAENEGGAFPRLEKLYIVMCPKLRGRLPVHLPSLVKLEISECSHLESSLPIDLFPKLTRLDIIGCKDLESLAVSEQHEHDGITDLNSCLHTLIINRGLSLISLPRGDSLSALKMLLINDCKKLELPMHRQYSSLSKLSLTASCDSLTFFPLDLFPKLKSIEIYGCMNLESLEQHGRDSVISQIKIHNCPNFVSFPKGGLRAPALTKFSIGGFKSPWSMPDKMHLLLPSLQSLEILECPEVESFPEGGLPSNLKETTICRCNKLNESRMGWGLQKLSSLLSLKIDGETEDVESFPGIGLLPSSLTHLGIYEFTHLKCLDNEGFQHLTSLQQLEISGCPNLKYMPEEGLPASLDILNLGDCPVVRERLQRPAGKEWRKITRVPNVFIDLGSGRSEHFVHDRH